MTSEYSGTLTWALVDLDLTMAEGVWSPEDPSDAIGRPIAGVHERLAELRRSGLHPIVWSARPWTHYKAVKHWLRLNDLWRYFQHDAGPPILLGAKPVAAVIIDDKNAGGLHWPVVG